MIRVRQLEMLCAVIENGTTSGAAETLFVSQPAVSNAIRHLEDSVGFPLFKREKGRLVPTPEALHIVQEAQHLFAQQKRVNRIIHQLKGGNIGQLNIIATPSVGSVMLPELLTEFTLARPRITIALELGSVDDIVSRLISGRADLGFSITPPRHASLNAQILSSSDMVCVMPEGHELAGTKTINILDLNHVRHISYASSTPLGQMLDAVFSKEGVERRFFCEVRHTSTALQMVAAGAGAAIVDRFALIGQKQSGLVIREVSPSLHVSLHGVTSNLFPTSNLALQFENFVRDWLGKSETGVKAV